MMDFTPDQELGMLDIRSMISIAKYQMVRHITPGTGAILLHKRSGTDRKLRHFLYTETPMMIAG